MPLRYRALLFDLDGTLVDSYAALATAVNHALREYGFNDLTETSIRQHVGDGIEKLLERAFQSVTVPASVIATFEKRYDEVCCGESHILDEVQATLAVLEERGVVMAVCTNKPTGFSTKILAHLGLARFFCAIVGPDTAGARKPDARHVLFTLEATQRAPREALFVGDMPIDIHAARNSGIDVAAVATGSSSPEQLRAAAPDHFLARFSDLVRIVEGVEA